MHYKMYVRDVKGWCRQGREKLPRCEDINNLNKQYYPESIMEKISKIMR